jgi:hypothetical protein
VGIPKEVPLPGPPGRIDGVAFGPSWVAVAKEVRRGGAREMLVKHYTSSFPRSHTLSIRCIRPSVPLIVPPHNTHTHAKYDNRGQSTSRRT